MSRWLRIDVDWSDSDWVAEMGPVARLCWVLLMCKVKANGSEGRVRLPSPSVLARQWDVPREAVEEMIAAATSHGALVVSDGTATLTSWAKYQGDPTNAERQARSRERRKSAKAVPSNGGGDEPQGQGESNGSVTESNGEGTQSNGGNALLTAVTGTREEKRGEETTGDTPPTPPGGDAGGELVTVEPPWWSECPPAWPARMVAETVVGVVGPKGAWYPPPDRKPCEELADRVVGIVGADGFGEAWGELASSWVEHHSGRRKAPYALPLSALGKWVTKREPDWRRVRRQREIDADRASRSTPGGHVPPGRMGIADQVRGALALIEGGEALEDEP